jgi:hypothetical protein
MMGSIMCCIAGYCLRCFTIAWIASSLSASCSSVPSSISSAICVSPVCPSSSPYGVYPNGVFPACENCSIFRCAMCSSIDSFPCICFQIPVSFCTSNIVSMVFFRPEGFACPLIFLPIFLNDLALTRFSPLLLISFSINSLRSNTRTLFPSVRCGCLLSTRATAASCSYWVLLSFIFFRVFLNLTLTLLALFIHSVRVRRLSNVLASTSVLAKY